MRWLFHIITTYLFMVVATLLRKKGGKARRRTHGARRFCGNDLSGRTMKGKVFHQLGPSLLLHLHTFKDDLKWWQQQDLHLSHYLHKGVRRPVRPDRRAT